MKKTKLKFYSTNPNVQDRPINDNDLLRKMKQILTPNNWVKKRKKRVRKYSELNADEKLHIDEILKRNKRK